MCLLGEVLETVSFSTAMEGGPRGPDSIRHQCGVLDVVSVETSVKTSKDGSFQGEGGRKRPREPCHHCAAARSLGGTILVVVRGAGVS